MKTIINNPYILNETEINKITNKVRALIIDENNNILVTKYADIYMLPGGKIDKGENIESALIRELKEELGIEFDIKELEPFLEFKNYLSNYPIVDSNKLINKLNKTTYFVIKIEKEFDIDKIKLTEREKKNNFSITNLKLDEALNIISNHNSNNPRNQYFKLELIKVLEEFIKTNKKHNKLIDLHTHTSFSDGELTPNELIKYAIKKQVGTLAITDHDTLEGLKAIDKNNILIKGSNIKLINGIELSAKFNIGRMHILGYGIDIYNKKLNNKLIELNDNSINSVLSIIEQIKKDYNIFFTYDELKELINSNHNLGRPDIARLLIKNGYVNTMQEAFDKYLIDAYNKIGNRKKGIQFGECINLIIESNGIPVLAHPKTLNLSDKELLYLLKDMINVGLKGIEVYHSSHTEEETKKYLDIANELGLLISGGSDYHGINTKPDIEIGTGKNNNLKIKHLSILDKIN